MFLFTVVALTLWAFGFSFTLTTVFVFLRASPQERFRGPPAPVNVLSSELVLDTLSHSWILVGLDVRHLPVQDYGGDKTCLTSEITPANPFFTPFRLRT
jgi:hypothetical protein